jgi:trigger factor
MKSAVETLSPTRIKLTVEVPFDELKPSLESAYKKIGQQVRIKGFRPGKVPPAMIDQYVGRGAVLDEAVNEAIPRLYGAAVRENEVDILGHPEIEVTQFSDGDQLVFTAEVDVRPEIQLPAYDGLAVVVDDAAVSHERVEEQLQHLRERFATLKGVERAAQQGDYVSIDLAATIDGEPLDEASASNLSYEVGSDSLVTGLDEAVVGLAAGESKAFETQLRSGPHGGETASVTVTVKSVKEKEVPALDNDFAQTASEFDTIDELRADISERLTRVARLQQGVQARDRAVEALLALVEIPMPEHVLEDEINYRKESMDQQLQQLGTTREAYAEIEGKSVEELDRELEDGAKEAIRAQFVLDAIARKEELQVGEAELTDTIVRRARQAGMRADEYAQQIVNSGQLGALMSEVLRGKALAFVLEHAKIADASGNAIDLDSLTREFDEPPAEAPEADTTDEPPAGDGAEAPGEPATP